MKQISLKTQIAYLIFEIAGFLGDLLSQAETPACFTGLNPSKTFKSAVEQENLGAESPKANIATRTAVDNEQSLWPRIHLL